MSGNQVEPPTKWQAAKRINAVFTYNVETCQQCGRMIPAMSWAFRVGGQVWCEKCWDNFEGGYAMHSAH